MTRPIVLSNSRLHVGIGADSDVLDLYYPYVGYADHLHRFSLGVFADGRLSWLNGDWQIRQSYLENCPIGVTEATSDSLQLKVTATDFVHEALDIFWRKITVQNLSRTQCDVRLFAYHDLHIDENPLGDTAVVDPHLQGVVHYKNDFYFGFCSNPVFDQYAAGRKEWGGLQGTWKDAEDGILSGNAVSNGSVDSCVGWNLGSLQPSQIVEVQMFVVVGRHFRDLAVNRATAMSQGFEKALLQTQRYWQNWVARGQDESLTTLPDRVHRLYNRSMLILRSMCSQNGAMIASSDSDIERLGGDTYDYVWPRDASWCAIALDMCGYHDITRKFFSFMFGALTEKGYFLHKYYPTGMFGSTWQPVPFIQIDQTGIILHALWNFYQTTGDVEFVAQHWKDASKIATFLMSWRDKENKLPHPSWDLWEERKATCTYSAAAVYAGLKAASNLAEIVGFEDEGLRFESAAGEVKNGILDHLYDPSLGRFLRSVNPRDETVDSSLLAISSFGVLPPQDQRYLGTVKAVEDQLWVKGDIGGVARYPGDGYLRVSNQFTGNPWILTTLYLAISRTDMDDLVGAKQLIEWATDRATSTNLLPEQVNAYDGSPIGVLPLAWSHAAYILAVKRLAAKLSDKGAKWDVLS